MHHAFNTQIAEKYGVNAAILLENIQHWVVKNKANNANIRDGYAWTYNSVAAFGKIFTYLSDKEIRNALAILIKAGEVIKGEYNKQNYDRTSWYTCEVGKVAICTKGQMDSPLQANGFAPTGKPIPDINTNINTDIKSVAQAQKKPLLENRENRFIEDLPETYYYKETENLNTKKETKPANKQSIVITLDKLEIPQSLSNSRFLDLYEKFLKEPKQRKKTIGAHNLTLQKLERYDLEFAIELVEAAMCSNYQGVVFSDTPAKYLEWQKKRKGIQSQKSLAERSMQIGIDTIGFKGINFDDLDFTGNG